MLLRGLQEVTLRRKNSDDRLGLTLYYRDAYNGTSDVIVGEVSKPIYLFEYSSIPRPTVFFRFTVWSVYISGGLTEKRRIWIFSAKIYILEKICWYSK